MDSKLNENMGNTTFGNTAIGSWFNPSGKFGQWFSRFFASKQTPVQSTQAQLGPTEMHPLAGDAFVSDDVIKGDAAIGYLRTPKMPEIELNRKNRYNQLEQMDEYPEIGAAFDIYADDCTQKTIFGVRAKVKSQSKFAVDEINELFETLKIDRYIWDIARNTVKYGDCFVETVVNVNDPKQGIQRIKILNPNFILRVENEYGYLTDFLQEIPDKNSDWSAFGEQGMHMGKAKYITLDKNQIVHFRLHTSDPKFYPYGKSIAAYAIRVFRSLKLMEDAMLIYRLTRAPERRVFYINTGSLPTNKAEAFVEDLKRKFKKEKFHAGNIGSIDEKLNPMSFDEDFFVPHRGDKETRIEVLPGAQNLGEVDDVKYFRDKLLASLKIPKDYVVEHDKSPERKANLSQLDVKFARVIVRVQEHIQAGLETIARRHLVLKGFPASIINKLKIELAEPSDMFTKRRLDVDDQKTRVIQAIKGLGLFSNQYIYKVYYEMTDAEITEMEKQLEKDLEKAQQQRMLSGGMGADPMGGGMPGQDPMAGGGMPGEEGMSPGEDPNMDAGLNPAENQPPTQKESLARYMSKLLVEDNKKHAKLKKLMRKYAR